MFRDGGKDYRKKAFAHFTVKCALCDYDVEDVLQVHHKDEDRSNNELPNLVILCPTHHVEVHKGLSNL